MTNEELIAMIKAEIERLKENVPYRYHPYSCASVLEAYNELLSFLSTLESEKQKEWQEVDLEKFTEKMDAWKARYNNSDNIPIFSIKATMAFTARMFYMYPNIAREWYDSLPKVTLD